MSGLMALLVLTGLGAATARGAMAASGEICAITIPPNVVMAEDGLPLFNADGAPVTLADMASCLECLTVTAGLPDQMRAPSSAALVIAVLDPMLLPIRGGGPRVWRVQARAPPRTV